MFRFLIKLLCLFGAHRWVKKGPSIRVCIDCDKQQQAKYLSTGYQLDWENIK